MRRPLALVLVVCACDPLFTGNAPTDEAGCPKPCALPCEGACLPTGFCAAREVTLTLSPVLRSGHETIAIPGFPSDAPVNYEVRLGTDVEGRAGQDDPSAGIEIEVDSQDLVDVRGLSGAGPAWTTHVGSARTGTDGVVRLDLSLKNCVSHGDSATCVFDPGSTATASLVSTTDWKEAPPCAPSPP